MTQTRERDISADARGFVPPPPRDRSRTTVAYAKWIYTCDDEPDHAGQTLATRNPDVVRAWAEARGGVPATFDGALALDFPHDGSGADSGLQAVAWAQWLDAFQERELVFLHQETLANGRQSNFFRLDLPDRQ